MDDNHDDEVMAMIDGDMLINLIDEGYPKLRAARALLVTASISVDRAREWLEQHKYDKNIDAPITTTGNAEETDSSATSNPDHVQESLDKHAMEQLSSMGFPLIRAEKALFLSSNKVEAALNWLEDHQADEDVDVPLSIQGSQPPKPKLSPEEAKAKACELQQKLREQRILREKEDEKQREKDRIASSKLMLETKRKLDEANRLREAELRDREKQKHDEEKRQLRELVKRDWEARHGKPYPGDEAVAVSAVSKMSSKEQVIHWINIIKKTYKVINRTKKTPRGSRHVCQQLEHMLTMLQKTQQIQSIIK
eukprot:GHVL01031643.1.p1 GENE.GHVL01031643.1~~GHVL01031643.1.p1  ORF type:complete len:309 (+),score=63.62 GHVL01031643.1:55-981(+)